MFLIKLIFIISLFGIFIIIFKKIPRLLQFSSKPELGGKEELAPKRKIVDVENLEKRFSLWLGKLFKKFRIYALKFENLSARLSTKFHERSKVLSKSKKDYWEQFKNEEQAENKQES